MWLALEACIEEEEEEEEKKRECGSAEMAMCVARHAAWLLPGGSTEGAGAESHRVDRKGWHRGCGTGWQAGCGRHTCDET